MCVVCVAYKAGYSNLLWTVFRYLSKVHNVSLGLEFLVTALHCICSHVVLLASVCAH